MRADGGVAPYRPNSHAPAYLEGMSTFIEGQHSRGQAGKFTTKTKPGAGVVLSAEEDPPQVVYATRDEAIQREITEPLASGEGDNFATGAIADEVLAWHSDIHADGTEHLDSSGYVVSASGEEFWDAVSRHDPDRPAEDRAHESFVAGLSAEDRALAERMVSPLGKDAAPELRRSMVRQYQDFEGADGLQPLDEAAAAAAALAADYDGVSFTLTYDGEGVPFGADVGADLGDGAYVGVFRQECEIVTDEAATGMDAALMYARNIEPMLADANRRREKVRAVLAQH